jgi:hypothetical protein
MHSKSKWQQRRGLGRARVWKWEWDVNRSEHSRRPLLQGQDVHRYLFPDVPASGRASMALGSVGLSSAEIRSAANSVLAASCLQPTSDFVKAPDYLRGYLDETALAAVVCS